MTEVGVLFEEFASRHARGESPDVREYLERADTGRAELARLLDRYLESAPVRESGAETRAIFASLVPAEESTTPPLLAERVRRGWRRSDVVGWIVERFAIGSEKAAKVDAYWHQVETGLLPVSRVSHGLQEWIEERFEEAVQREGSGLVLYESAPAYHRLAGQSQPQAQISTEFPETPAVEPDEVDRLFGSS